MGQVTVVRAGPLTTVQDLGRGCRRREGVSGGGALDLFSARVVNLLVGNPEGAALLEITLGGLCLRFEGDRQVAWSGGAFAARLAAKNFPAGRAGIVRANEELEFAGTERGCRAWLAIGGGIEVAPVLGSRATDLRAGFGGYQGRALRNGDRLSLGNITFPSLDAPRLAEWSAPADWTQTAKPNPLLRIVAGSEWDEFVAEAQTAFLRQTFTVSPQADRMGARLTGAQLQRTNNWELPSEAVAPGTVQVAHDGQPIILLGDCQTIGGYPKIAHVITVDLPRAAQLRPNDTVRFEAVTPADAGALFAERELDWRRFRVGLALRTK